MSRTPLLLLGLLVLGSPALAGDVFTVNTLSQARDAAGDTRLAVVFIGASDDQDAAFMASQAWTHPDVSAWVDQHAVAARVDARSFHGAKLRTVYGLGNGPAILAFRGDELVRQHEGVLEAKALLAWLKVVGSGDIAAADMVLEASAPPDGEVGAIDVEARLVQALAAENATLAATQLLAVWTETVGTPQQDARRPRVLEALAPRVEADPTARERTVSGRDAAWQRYRKDGALPDLMDWIALNRLLGEDGVTQAWVSETSDSKGGRKDLNALMRHPDDPLLPMFVVTGEWAMLGNVITDPQPILDQNRKTYEETAISITGVESEADQAAHRREQGAVVAGLLAASRDREAREAMDHILTLDKDAGPMVVQTCIDAREPRRWMRKYLDPTKKAQVALAMELTQALQGL